MKWTMDKFYEEIIEGKLKKDNLYLYIHLKSAYDRHDVKTIYSCTGLDFRGILKEENYKPLFKINNISNLIF